LTLACTVGIVPIVTGDELRRLRRKAGLTQVQVAERLGVTSTSVARWERGERAISEPVARLITLLLGGMAPESQRPKGRGGS
jgi:transcriptional regulator with XRE-family HTH domain